MSLWVVDDYTVRQAQEAVQTLLTRLRPSIAVLGNLRHPSGAAALIDAGQGLFLAHADSVQGDTIQARVGDGAIVLRVLTRDSRTNLVLLGPKAMNGPLAGPSISLVEADPAPGTKVIVLLADDAVAGSYVGGERFSIVGANKQVIPVTELRFETPPRFVSGALVFTYDGKLLGSVGATVARPGRTSDSLREAVGLSKSFPSPMIGLAPKSLAGPADLTVAYSPSLVLMRRVVEGFVSSDHRAEYSVLGIQVADAPDGGAKVTRVFSDTPAGKAGVREGDVLLAIGDYPIARRVDFVRTLLELRPGEKTALRLRRKSAEIRIDVVLARSKG